MLKISHISIVLGMLFFSVPSSAQVSIGIGLPNLSIGINLRSYPELVVVPGYPVYYAPREDANLFFYDGMYWIFQGDNWYASAWYNGPWGFVDREIVPLYILRIPVAYYRQPPAYFHGWQFDAPPRWGDHWGHDWEQQRSGWNRWNRHVVPTPAPLPVYQRQYSGDRYPRHVEQQHEFQKQNYHYQPHDPVVRQHDQERAKKSVPVQQGKRIAPEERDARQLNPQRSTTYPQSGSVLPHSQSQQRGAEESQRPVPDSLRQERPEARDHRPQPEPDKREQQKPGSQSRDATREPKHGQEKERGRSE